MKGNNCFLGNITTIYLYNIVGLPLTCLLLCRLCPFHSGSYYSTTRAFVYMCRCILTSMVYAMGPHLHFKDVNMVFFWPFTSDAT